MKCNPWRWMWGLIPIIVLGWVAVMIERPRIEADLASRTKEALGRAGYSWATVAFTGRDGLLIGKTVEENDPAAALKTTAETWGVRNIQNSASLVDKIDKYEWAAVRRDNRIRLDGLVPNDRTRREVVGIVKANFPGLEVDDRMALARGAPPLDTWIGGVSFGLKQLAVLKSGRIDIEKTTLSILGEARDVAGYRAIKSALATGLPQGIRLGNDGVKPPFIKQYQWSVERTRARVLLTGRVPSDTVREDFLTRARHLLPNVQVEDQMAPGDGAPDSFVAAAMLLLQELAKIDEGTGEINDTAVAFNGVAETAEAANATRAALKQAMPATFRMSDNIKHREPQIKTVSPYVTTIALEGRHIMISGSAPSDEARQTILGALRQWPGGAELNGTLDIAAGQPPAWQSCLDAGVAALKQLGNGRIVMTDRQLAVEGATQVADLPERLQADLRSRAGRDCEAVVRVAFNGPAARDSASSADQAKKAAEDAARRAAADAERRQVEEKQKAAADAAREQARKVAEETARRLEDERRRAEADKRKADEEKKRQAAAVKGALPPEEARKVQAASACEVSLRTVVRSGIIQFDRASAELEAQSLPTLRQLAAAASRCPDVRIEIEGHTDADGTPERNQALSERRAQAVADFLTGAGVPENRLHTIGYGEARGLAPNDTPANKAKNRRIEFSVTTQ